MRIDADDYDAATATEIAQKTAEVFVERIKVTMLEQDQRDRVEVSIRDYALPAVLHKPKTKINTLAGGIFGIVAGVVVVFLIEWLETDVVRSVEDVERQTRLSVIGMIPGNVSSQTKRSVLRSRAR